MTFTISCEQFLCEELTKSHISIYGLHAEIYQKL